MNFNVYMYILLPYTLLNNHADTKLVDKSTFIGLEGIVVYV